MPTLSGGESEAHHALDQADAETDEGNHDESHNQGIAGDGTCHLTNPRKTLCHDVTSLANDSGHSSRSSRQHTSFILDSSSDQGFQR